MLGNWVVQENSGQLTENLPCGQADYEGSQLYRARTRISEKVFRETYEAIMVDEFFVTRRVHRGLLNGLIRIVSFFSILY